MFSVLSLGSQSVVVFSLLTAGIPDHTGTCCDSFTVEDGKRERKERERERQRGALGTIQVKRERTVLFCVMFHMHNFPISNVLELWYFDLFVDVTECFWLSEWFLSPIVLEQCVGERSARGQLYRSAEAPAALRLWERGGNGHGQGEHCVVSKHQLQGLENPERSRQGIVNCLTAMGNASLCSLPFFPSPSLSPSLSFPLSLLLYFFSLSSCCK